MTYQDIILKMWLKKYMPYQLKLIKMFVFIGFLSHFFTITALKTASDCVRDVWLGLDLRPLLIQQATLPLEIGVAH